MKKSWSRIFVPILLASFLFLWVFSVVSEQSQVFADQLHEDRHYSDAQQVKTEDVYGQQDLPNLTDLTSMTTDVFTDVTAAVGVTAVHTKTPNYYTTGQAWGDYNGDGWLDLYLTNSEGPNTLYENTGGTFQVSALSASVALTNANSGGAIFTDYNNDGWTDLYVLNLGANKLYRNDSGTGFVDVTETAGVGDMLKGETAAWGDYDKDGNLDLYVTNWACGTCVDPPGLEGNRDRLYHNNGDGTFTDITAALGFTHTLGAGFVASFVDYDNDDDLDIYLVNDREKGPNVNILWRNDGPGCGEHCFTDVSVSSGANIWVAGMGLSVHDYDHDGDLDFYFSNLGPSVLLQNQTSQGSPTFVDVAPAAGVAYDAISWGNVSLDYDNDGWNDLYLGVMEGYPGVANYLSRNLGDGTFDTVANASGAASNGPTLGVAYGDYNNDGWVDIVIGNYDLGYALYRNQGASLIGNNWIVIKLQGSGAINHDAIGSRVYVHTSDGEIQMQELKSGSSLGAGNDLALYFGLGAATITQITVEWPDGTSKNYTGMPVNQIWGLSHGVDIVAAPDLDIDIAANPDTALLQWRNGAACQYDLHTSSEPLFVLGAGTLYDSLNGRGFAAFMPNAIGDETMNHYFVVRAKCNGVTADSNAVGEFDFVLSLPEP